MVATNAACKLFVLLACVVSFQITKPGNLNRKKIFVSIPDHENIFTRKFKTRKFPDLRHVVCVKQTSLVKDTNVCSVTVAVYWHVVWIKHQPYCSSITNHRRSSGVVVGQADTGPR